MNYYELFDIPEGPVVDRAGLSLKYFDLQKKYHPDFYTQASQEEKQAVMERSAMINQAFRVFTDPEKTLEYYLKMKQVIADDEKYTLAQDFLMDMMELNEEMAGMDRVTAQQQINQLEEELSAPVRQYLEPSSANFQSEEALKALKEYYFRKKYVRRILDRLGD